MITLYMYVPYEINFMCDIEMAVRVTYERHVWGLIYLESLMLDCGIASVLAMERVQSCTQSST